MDTLKNQRAVPSRHPRSRQAARNKKPSIAIPLTSGPVESTLDVLPALRSLSCPGVDMFAHAVLVRTIEFLSRMVPQTRLWPTTDASGGATPRRGSPTHGRRPDVLCLFINILLAATFVSSLFVALRPSLTLLEQGAYFLQLAPEGSNATFLVASFLVLHLARHLHLRFQQRLWDRLGTVPCVFT